MALRIEDYAIVGDCQTAAMIGRDGSVDWLCWPRFDSAACFAALLGTPEHGRWLIAAADPKARVTRRYRDDTLILETDFETPDGAATLIDFMPVQEGAHHLVRIVTGRRGQLAMRTELVLRFDYGATVPWVTRADDGALEAVAGPDMTLLRTPIDLRGEDFKTLGDFTVSEGQTVPFVLSFGRSYRERPAPIDPNAALSDTEVFWRNWSAGCTGMGEWSALVRRSLITLKALTYRPTGGIVAAPTMALPERFGGTRNWDYRYCWIRDASLTLLSLMHGGFYEEAQDWRIWLRRAVAGHPAQAQIMYGIAGERWLPEVELPWLPGYQGAGPVRIGNAASGQFQLDVYGEILDAFYQASRGGLGPVDHGPDLLRALLDHVAEVWREPDEGMWEVRGPRQHFTHSKVMAWVAFDRAIRSAEAFGFEGPVEKWKVLRARDPRRRVCQRLQREVRRVRAALRRRYAGRIRSDDAPGWVPASHGSACGQHRGGDRAQSHGRWIRYALRYDKRGRRVAPRRGRVSGVQLLARRLPFDAGQGRRRPRAFQKARRALQRRGAAGGGVRSHPATPRGQLPAGVLAYRARQHRPQSRAD